MSSFRAIQLDKDKELRRRLPSLPPEHPYSYHGMKTLGYAWGKFVSHKANVDVRADLTFRQKIVVSSAPVWGAAVVDENVFINEGYAISNITAFLNRLNYACYKHAYKRYGKRLEVVSCIHGGDRDLREGVSLTDMEKRLHTHLLLQLPAHMDFERFKCLIEKHWKDTSWGYDVNVIEPIKSRMGSARYNVGNTMDCIDLQNTNFAEEK